LIDPEPAVPDRFDGGAAMLTYTTRDIAAAYEAAKGDSSVRVLSKPAALDAGTLSWSDVVQPPGAGRERLEICETLWS